MVPGVPVTLCQTQRSEKIPRNFKPVSKRARTTAPPGPHSGAGRVRRPGGMPRTATGPPLLVGVRRAAKHNRRGKQKQQKETTKTPLPPHVQKKGLRRAPGKSQKRAGPRMASRKNSKKRDARPKRANKQARRDKKGTGRSNPSACGGVPCYYLSILSLKKSDVGEETKGREKKNQKHKT